MRANEVTYHVFRFDPEVDKESRYETFPVSAREGMTVLDGLIYILENLDNSLALRFSCREGVCGSCAMFINGSYRLACQTQLAELHADDVYVSPLPHLPVIRDLVVDMTRFFEKYEKVVPYLLNSEKPPEKEWLQSQQDRKKIDEVIDCILCASCYSSCPMVWTDGRYLGPAAMTKAYRFVADSRDRGARQRLSVVDSEDGVWRCHTIFNCVEACPKNINPTYAIQQMKKKAVIKRLKFWER